MVEYAAPINPLTPIDISHIPKQFFDLPLPMAEMTDFYFNNTAAIAKELGDSRVRYAVFLRTPSVVAVELMLQFLRMNYPDDDLVIDRLYPEGALVTSGKKIVEFEGKHSLLSAMETQLLDYFGWPCVSAYNAYQMALACPDTPFLAMEARHVPGWMAHVMTSYGAAVGSHAARLQGAKGFTNSSTTLAAPFFGQTKGAGTMPHALIGLVKVKKGGVENPTVNAVLEAGKLFVDVIDGQKNVVLLPDYDGKEISQSLDAARWFFDSGLDQKGYTFGVRLDTHGGRYLEGLDWANSVETLKDWTKLDSPDDIIDLAIQGLSIRSFDGKDPLDIARRHLFDTGVTAAAIAAVRLAFDKAGFGRDRAKIVASSGFNLIKCQMLRNLRTPIDVIGTGSFIPDRTSPANGTADIYRYDGKVSIKVGREYLAGNS